MRYHVPDPAPYARPFPAPAPQRKRRIWPWLLAGALAFGACMAGGLALLGAAAAEPDGQIVRHTVAPAVQSPPTADGKGGKATRRPAAAVKLGSGDHERVAAGTYVTDAPADTFGCVWQRVTKLDHEPSSFIAGDIVGAGEHGQLIVKADDGGLLLDGPCTWVKK